jgi:hypothetical protein
MHTPRRMLVAKDKRAEGDTTPVNVIRTNVLVPYAATIAPTPSEVEPAPEAPAPEAPAPVAVEAPAPEAPAPEAPAPEAPAPVAEEAPGGRPRLRDLPLSHLAHKFRPWKVSFWRSALGRAAESTRG